MKGLILEFYIRKIFFFSCFILKETSLSVKERNIDLGDLTDSAENNTWVPEREINRKNYKIIFWKGSNTSELHSRRN